MDLYFWKKRILGEDLFYDILLPICKVFDSFNIGGDKLDFLLDLLDFY